MSKKNLKVNAILNVVKTSLSIIFPLITYPYVIRTLGTAGLGKVSYTASIISYFSLFAMLGVSTYGVREGAKKREEKEELNRFVSEVFTINLIATILSYLALFIVLATVSRLQEYRWLILLQSISIIFTTIGMDWINTVFEEFKWLTIRSIITHIISLVLLFLIVHTARDYYLYASLSVFTNFIICVTNLFYIKKRVKVRIILSSSLCHHVKPLLILFANTVAILVYVNFDTTMLGWYKGDYDVGLYVIPVKIYTVLKTMLAAVYAVAIPRLAKYAGDEEFGVYKTTFSSLCSYLTVLLIPVCVGFGCISYEILFIMGDVEATGGTISMQILAGSLFFAIYGGLITAVLNITINREKNNLFATIGSAALNFGLNLLLIPVLSLNGAAITTLVSECFVLIFCLIKDKDVFYLIDKKKIIVSLTQSLVGSIGIIVIVIVMKQLITTVILRTILIISSSVLLYSLIMIILKNECMLLTIEACRKQLKRHFKN